MVVIHSSGIVTVNAVQRRWPAIGGSTGTNRSSDNWLNEPVGRGEKIITRFSANTKCNRSSMPSLDKHHGAEFENSVKSAYVCNTRSLLECNHKEQSLRSFEYYTGYDLSTSRVHLLPESCCRG